MKSIYTTVVAYVVAQFLTLLLCEKQGRLLLGTGGARIALHVELFPSLLSCKGGFSGVVNGQVEENFPGGKPPDPQIPIL